MLFRAIKDLKSNLKWRCQRFHKGYSDPDIWGMNYWFFNQIPKMLRELRELKHGTPMCTFPEVDTFPKYWIYEQMEDLKKFKQTLDLAEEDMIIDLTKGSKDGNHPNPDRWWMLITRIIWCFEQANPDTELFNPYWDEIWQKYYKAGNPEDIPQELHKKYLATLEKNDDFKDKCKDEGMDLLKEYIYTLWD